MNMSIQTELLEHLDWDEQKVDKLINCVLQIVNDKNTISLISTVENKLIQLGYSDIVVDLICNYINNTNIQKGQQYDY